MATGRTEPAAPRYVLFSDQSAPLDQGPRSVFSHHQLSARQSRYLEKVAVALAREINGFSAVTRECFPSFHSVHELFDHYQKQECCVHPALSASLLCIVQILETMRLFESEGLCQNIASTKVIGLCIGCLPAAAYAYSSCLEDLESIAVPVTCIAFRVGYQATTGAQSYYGRQLISEPCSMIVSSNTQESVSKALKEHAANTVPSAGCYISAVAHSSVTVSGRPAALENVRQSLESLKGKTVTRIPVHAPYHAPHIHRDVDAQWLLCGNQLKTKSLLERFQRGLPLLSTSSGKQMSADSLYVALDSCIKDILISQLRWDCLVQEVVTEMQRGHQNCEIMMIGPSGADAGLSSALRSIANVETVLKRPDFTFLPDAENVREPLAIVGMAGRFPDADSTEEFWQNLESGLDSHREIPSDRFDISTHVDPSGKEKNTSWTPYGCFIRDPGHFDPALFRMSPREARQTDPMQRLALVTAYEALEMSGYVPNRTHSTSLRRIGTFYGQTSDDYREVNASQEIDTYFITGGIRAFGPGRVNYYFKFSGPSYNIDTACSSSLAAIQIACDSIWNGNCDTAVAGGLSVLTSSDLYSGLSRGSFLSQTGGCKTYDDAADGYCRADAIATLVIKRLSDAVADGDRILSTVLSAMTNHSGEAVSITHPHAGAQSTLYREVLSRASVDPIEVDYIEMHGTGTQAGDGIEMQSVTEVFAPSYRRRDADKPLYVGSAKANIGHGEAASGVTAVVKSIMMLQKGTIPPHVGIKGALNKGFPDLKAMNVNICLNKTMLPLPKHRESRIFINNFSAAGGNTALLLQGYTDTTRETFDPRTSHVVTLSGNTTSSLQRNIERLIAFATRNPIINLSDLSYTTTARRMHHRFRLSVVGSNIEDVTHGLSASLSSVSWCKPVTKRESIVFVFSGQGSLYQGVARALFDNSSFFKNEVESLDAICIQQGFASFKNLISCDEAEFMNLTPTQTQLGQLCIEVALYHFWGHLGVYPTAVIGHSLGEYAAFVASGAMSSADAIYAVGSRAQLLEKICARGSHAMLAVRKSYVTINELIMQARCSCEVSCVNAPEQTVLSGTVQQISQMEAFLQSQNIKTTKVPLPYAFHSAQIDQILENFEDCMATFEPRRPEIPVLSTLLGRPLQPHEKIDASYLCRHAREIVRFAPALEEARNQGVVTPETIFIELGPSDLCSGMIRSTLNDDLLIVNTLSKHENSWKTLARTTAALHDAGLKIGWVEYQHLVGSKQRLLHLPSYSFDDKNYWIDYKRNWCLTKGADDHSSNSIGPSLQESPMKKISTTVHRLAAENSGSTPESYVFETDLAYEPLHNALCGHLVNSVALCPSSIYADMAYTVCEHLSEHFQVGSAQACLNVTNMEVTTPLQIVLDRTKEKRILCVRHKLMPDQRSAEVSFTSKLPGTSQETVQAKCLVKYEDGGSLKSQWRRNEYLIKTRMDMLCNQADFRDIHSVSKSLAYRLFSNLVDYSPRFQGMSNVTFDSEEREATAKIVLGASETSEHFFRNPYWIDALIHLAGFILNGGSDPSAVYISHGWETLAISESLEAGATYKAYVRMQTVDSKVYAGDVWIMCNDKTVGMCEGLKFQKIPRATLKLLLPSANKGTDTRVDSIAPNGQYKDDSMSRLQSQRRNQNTRPNTKISNMVTGFAPPSTIYQHATDLERRVRSLLASELGMPEDEIGDHDKFDDLGLDSLLSLAFIASLKETLDIDVSQKTFRDHSSVGSFLTFLGGNTGKWVSEPPLRVSRAVSLLSPSSRQERTDVAAVMLSGALTPDSVSSDDESVLSTSAADVRIVIARTMGVEINELTPYTDLHALGLDSLMAIVLRATLKEELDLNVEPTFFTNNETMRDIEIALGLESGTAATSPACGSRRESISEKNQSLHAPPQAASVLLQDSTVDSVLKQLFLLPDGSGSPVAYATLPLLIDSVRLYGLQCPYLYKPDEFICGFQSVADAYVAEIRRRQPHGPYHLGGWSAGGVLAFEAVHQLAALGERVETLVLIDAPSPTALKPMPGELISFLESLGAFGDVENAGATHDAARRRMHTHFDATVRNLALYKARPLPISAVPQTVYTISATKGVLSSIPGREPPCALEEDKTATWILRDRQMTDDDAWDGLLPGAKINRRYVDATHFSMMQEPQIQEVADHLRQLLQ